MCGLDRHVDVAVPDVVGLDRIRFVRQQVTDPVRNAVPRAIERQEPERLERVGSRPEPLRLAEQPPQERRVVRAPGKQGGGDQEAPSIVAQPGPRERPGTLERDFVRQHAGGRDGCERLMGRCRGEVVDGHRPPGDDEGLGPVAEEFARVSEMRLSGAVRLRGVQTSPGAQQRDGIRSLERTDRDVVEIPF